MKISSLNFKNNLRGNAVLSLIHGKEMILKNEVKDFLQKSLLIKGLMKQSFLKQMNQMVFYQQSKTILEVTYLDHS